jgi:hypothetical protein
MLLFALGAAWAEDPLVGYWQMIYQKMGGEHQPPAPLGLKVVRTNKGFEFSYLYGRQREVTMTFTANFDGKQAVVTDGKGAQIGTVVLSRSGAAYTMVLQSTNRPPEPGKMTISEKGRILTCESDGLVPGKGVTRIIQVFSREQDR